MSVIERLLSGPHKDSAHRKDFPSFTVRQSTPNDKINLSNDTVIH